MYKQAKLVAMFPFSFRFSYRPASLCGGYNVSDAVHLIYTLTNFFLQSSPFTGYIRHQTSRTFPRPSRFQRCPWAFTYFIPTRPLFLEKTQTRTLLPSSKKVSSQFIRLELLTIFSIVSLQCMAWTKIQRALGPTMKASCGSEICCHRIFIMRGFSHSTTTPILFFLLDQVSWTKFRVTRRR